ncbi:hypothetical protein F5Y01DRAFT_279959 [Xylaria sp. FL0043]|nr:hypothetical protein F5Y01DRAFT_279959 [Xylaria sp. FL0043]
MVVILTGPKEPLDNLLRERMDLLTSFQDRIDFNNLSPRECLTLLDRKINNIEPGADTHDVKRLATNMVRVADAEFAQLRVREPGRKHEWILTEKMALACFKARFNDFKMDGGALAKVAVEETINGKEEKLK